MKMREAVEVVKEMAGDAPYALTFEISSWSHDKYTVYIAEKCGHTEGKSWDEAIEKAKTMMPEYQKPLPATLPDEEEP